MRLINLISLFTVITLVSMGTTWDSAIDDDATPNNLIGLEGKWQFSSFRLEQVHADGSRNDVHWLAAERGIELYWEFKNNGEFIATEKGGMAATGKWEVEIIKKDGNHIGEGRLVITGHSSFNELAKSMGMDKLTYIISTGQSTLGTRKTVQQLHTSVDATKLAPESKKFFMNYTYDKVSQ